jgi:hypothetical protein
MDRDGFLSFSTTVALCFFLVLFILKLIQYPLIIGSLTLLTMVTVGLWKRHAH